MTTSQSDPAAREVEALEEQVEHFLRQHLPAAWLEAIDLGDAGALAEARQKLDLSDWWVKLADAGYVAPAWPKEYGGLGVSPPLGSAVSRTLSRYKVPRFTNPVGLTQAGTSILRWGTEAQKQRFLRPIARHEEIWCQLFSEPGAGSDLASLSTRAALVGDEWVVRGQKVWTSMAHLADFGLLLARTDPDAPKHKGITAFLLPMRQPAVTVRPLPNLTGEVEFNEVFLDGARVREGMRIGEVNEGWRVAMSVLSSERPWALGMGGGWV